MLARSIVAAAACRSSQLVARRVHMTAYTRQQLWSGCTSRPIATPVARMVRQYSSKSLADEKIEEITELYATAKDEFEIAMEETEKATVYAEDDRAAAAEELVKVQEAYKAIIEGEDKDLAEEVKRRIGQRIRELEQGVKAMEELAQAHD